MTKQEIADKIISKISNKLGNQLPELSPDSTFESVGFDSLDSIEIIVDAEDEFNIQIPDNRLTMFPTVGVLVDYVHSSLNRKGGRKNQFN